MGSKFDLKVLLVVIPLTLTPYTYSEADNFMDVFNLYGIELDYKGLDSVEEELEETKDAYDKMIEESKVTEFYNACIEMADLESLYERESQMQVVVNGYKDLSSKGMYSDVSELLQYDKKISEWSIKLEELSNMLDKCGEEFELKEVVYDDTLYDRYKELNIKRVENDIGELENILVPVSASVKEEFGFQFDNNEVFIKYNKGVIYDTDSEPVISVLTGTVSDVSENEVHIRSSYNIELVYTNLTHNLVEGEYIEQGTNIGTSLQDFMFSVYIEGFSYNPLILLRQY